MVTPVVAVCIPTRDRPDLLERALDSVRLQDGADLRVIVVDNSPDGSAAKLCRRHPVDARYLREPRPGVAHVRNLLLEESERMGVDAVHFLDDDMVLAPGALSAFAASSAKFPGSVLTGPVHYVWSDPDTPGRVPFTRPEHADGDVLATTGTGNTWIPVATWQQLGRPQFDPAFGLSGGEDTDFFLRLTRGGSVVRWCAAAVARETVPADRATPAAVVERYERAGYINGVLALRDRSRLRVLTEALARIGGGWLLLVLPQRFARGLPNPRATMYGGIGRYRAVRGRPPRHYGGHG